MIISDNCIWRFVQYLIIVNCNLNTLPEELGILSYQFAVRIHPGPDSIEYIRQTLEYVLEGPGEISIWSILNRRRNGQILLSFCIFHLFVINFSFFFTENRIILYILHLWKIYNSSRPH